MFIYLKEEEKYVHVNYDSDTIVKKLDKGIYDLTKQGEYYLFQENKSFTKGQVAEAGVFKQVSTYTREYFSTEGNRVRELMNQPTRLGLFFKGEPGTGKTFLAAKMALELIEKYDGIGIYTTQLSLDLVRVVDAIRQKDPNRFIVFILDEFEKDYNNINSATKDKLLAFLDGGESRNNVLTIATANSLNNIPATLLDRPGRFELVVEFKIADKDILNNLIVCLIPDELKELVSTENIYNRVKSIQGLTIDKLKSIVRDTLTNYLIHGSENMTQVAVISRDDIKKQATKKVEKKKRRFNPFNPSTWGIEEENELCYSD
jgi:SpoVK/Ycf46/Vps4 family AAA+-type ATPase